MLPVVLVEQHEGDLNTQGRGGASHLHWSNKAKHSPNTHFKLALPFG